MKIFLKLIFLFLFECNKTFIALKFKDIIISHAGAGTMTYSTHRKKLDIVAGIRTRAPFFTSNGTLEFCKVSNSVYTGIVIWMDEVA